ncbi:MAG: hypothetical protein IJY23_02185 [Clostridia bacterium]|nr:hypothetical protein [Clostridia bacterium]
MATNMLKSKRAINIVSIAFAVTEILLWLVILLGGGRVLQFLSVVLAAAVSFLFFENKKEVISTEIALIFTCLADLCLVILDPIRQIPAMLFFSVTQLCYAVRLYQEERSERRKSYHVLTRVALTVILEGLMLAVLHDDADALTAITMFYFANLVLNSAFAFLSGRSKLFSIGLLCFIACDIFVGLGVLFTDYLALSEESVFYKIIHPDFNIVWFFYVPSQTLIALSLKKQNI